MNSFSVLKHNAFPGFKCIFPLTFLRKTPYHWQFNYGKENHAVMCNLYMKAPGAPKKCFPNNSSCAKEPASSYNGTRTNVEFHLRSLYLQIFKPGYDEKVWNDVLCNQALFVAGTKRIADDDIVKFVRLLAN